MPADPPQDLVSALADNAQPADQGGGTNLAQMSAMIQQAGKTVNSGMDIKDVMDNAPPIMAMAPGGQQAPPGTFIGMNGQPIPKDLPGSQVTMNKVLQSLWSKGLATDSFVNGESAVESGVVDVPWGKMPKHIRDTMPNGIGGQNLLGWKWKDLSESEKALLAQMIVQGDKERRDKLTQLDKLDVLRKALASRAD